ncbi:type VII secretion system-associated protein [Streptomyces mirabilis]|uniref:type VII secretion system-associated protein n=1 Tax=Streptomyces mirabilis TaxID=68239 RepID=UPI0036945DB2
MESMNNRSPVTVDEPSRRPRFLDVPRHVREAAAKSPGSVHPVVDPAWEGAGQPPTWATLGNWVSDERGEVCEWRENLEYRPSPRHLGFPEPTDETDEAIQLAVTGYTEDTKVFETLLAADVAVLLAPDRQPLVVALQDGLPAVPVFTSTAHLRSAGQMASDVVAVTELMDLLQVDSRLYVNAASHISLVVETRSLQGVRNTWEPR